MLEKGMHIWRLLLRHDSWHANKIVSPLWSCFCWSGFVIWGDAIYFLLVMNIAVSWITSILVHPTAYEKGCGILQTTGGP